MKEIPYPYNQQQRPFNGAEEVFAQYEDTAGNFHWHGTETGEHIVRKVIDISNTTFPVHSTLK